MLHSIPLTADVRRRPAQGLTGLPPILPAVKKRSFFEDHPGKIKQPLAAFKNSFNNRRVQQPRRYRFLRRWAA
jgi:hypothetical protein